MINLWNSFHIDFPDDTINRLQMTELVRRIFPRFLKNDPYKRSSFDLFRCNAEVVIGNLFKVFDPENTGSVVPTELLVAFSMSMKGSVNDKLR